MKVSHPTTSIATESRPPGLEARVDDQGATTEALQPASFLDRLAAALLIPALVALCWAVQLTAPTSPGAGDVSGHAVSTVELQPRVGLAQRADLRAGFAR